MDEATKQRVVSICRTQEGGINPGSLAVCSSLLDWFEPEDILRWFEQQGLRGPDLYILYSQVYQSDLFQLGIALELGKAATQLLQYLKSEQRA